MTWNGSGNEAKKSKKTKKTTIYKFTKEDVRERRKTE